jgi:probable rRNA maturation factor
LSVSVVWTVPPDGLDDAGVRRAVEAALAHGGRPGLELSVVLVDDATLAELHERFLGDPAPTDVLAFDLGDDGGPAGEVVVSVDRARDLAAERGVGLDRELALYLVHGALHLCGHDDHDEAERAAMRRAEAAVLAGLGFPDDPAPHDADGRA